MRVAFCSSEVVPFAKTGGMADVCGALPVALEKQGLDISVFMPGYKTIDWNGYKIEKLSASVSRSILGNNVKVYFIRHEKFFGRDGIYGDPHGDYTDNLERFQFFNERSLEVIKEEKLIFDIIHCHDWQSALISVYLKQHFNQDSSLGKTKSILTIHNLAYQGVFPREKFGKLKLEQKFFNPQAFEFYGQINLLKAGIVFSDQVTTVSPEYAKEIKTEKLGCGLEGVLKNCSRPVVGILNGIDTKIWDPASDPQIHKKYSRENPEGKMLNKKFLQENCGLPVKKDVPLFGFVHRLSYQKGLDLLAQAIDEILKMDLQIVFLGIGEEKYHRLLTGIQKKYPQKVSVVLDFSDSKARWIYAGCDLFLMPSIYEPCGLSQMISMRYGTIPVVYKTGGLADTVVAFDRKKKSGNGFLFDNYTPGALVSAVKEAIDLYREPELFRQLKDNAFNADFFWENPAQEYAKLYQCLLSD